MADRHEWDVRVRSELLLGCAPSVLPSLRGLYPSIYPIIPDSPVVAEANRYFTNNAIDFGSITGLTSIKFQLNVTTTAPGDSYDVSLIFGDATANSGPVPEPGTMGVVGIMGIGLLQRRRALAGSFRHGRLVKGHVK